MKNKEQRFLNRELSWLEFNQRVLDEAADPSVPLLERLLFLTITASNLDEFFMVRVGGLKLLKEAGVEERDLAQMTPAEQLSAIRQRVRNMLEHMRHLYQNEIAPELAAAGIRLKRMAELDSTQVDALQSVFKHHIFPALSPAAIRTGHRLPLLSNLGLYVLAKLAPEPRKRKPRYALIPIPRNLQRFIPVPENNDGNAYILLEDMISTFATSFFHGIDVIECTTLRTTRNADIHVDETYGADFARAMKRVIRQRRTSGCVRLEIAAGASESTIAFLHSILDVADEDVFISAVPLQLGDFTSFYGSETHRHLRYESWPPRQPAEIDPGKSLFPQIAAGDIMLSLPYETFDPLIRLIDEAADDPDVLAIKMVLYRTSANSPIVAALQRAASNGKSVTALIELKARFDEANNIAWAERMEHNGVQVIYGIKGLKTHAKICMIVRREAEGIVRYLHLGTGNYNAKTAKLYTDVGLLTRNDELGIDASAFFNTVCGYSEPRPYLKLVQAPIDLRERVIELIDAETAQAEQGNKAQIIAKMNALVDPLVIEALYRASQAGVQIDLIVRGVCCLRPGLPGLSENIRVISIIDRLLEHSRIFYFRHGGGRQVYIASADWMPRNLSRRIELMTPVEDRKCNKKLRNILKACLADTAKARIMQPDGSYIRATPAGQTGTRSQEKLYTEACNAAKLNTQGRRKQFEPHLPS